MMFFVKTYSPVEDFQKWINANKGIYVMELVKAEKNIIISMNIHGVYKNSFTMSNQDIISHIKINWKTQSWSALSFLWRQIWGITMHVDACTNCRLFTPNMEGISRLVSAVCSVSILTVWHLHLLQSITEPATHPM